MHMIEIRAKLNENTVHCIPLVEEIFPPAGESLSALPTVLKLKNKTKSKEWNAYEFVKYLGCCEQETSFETL